MSEMPIDIQTHFAYLDIDYYGFRVVEPPVVEESIYWSYENYKKEKLIFDYLLANGAEIDEKVIIDLDN
jgi:hypothetical protein